jgi:hypothetical protein
MLKVNDIVRIGNGSQLIITGISHTRPANPYLGVLVNGQGKQYKFGRKHNPVKVGEATPDHPALQALGQRKADKAIDPTLRARIETLLYAVDNGDLPTAKQYALLVKQLLAA